MRVKAAHLMEFNGVIGASGEEELRVPGERRTSS